MSRIELDAHYFDLLHAAAAALLLFLWWRCRLSASAGASLASSASVGGVKQEAKVDGQTIFYDLAFFSSLGWVDQAGTAAARRR